MVKPTKTEGWFSSKKGWNYIKDPENSEPYGTHYWNEQGKIVRDNLLGDDSRVIMDRVVPFVESAATKPISTLNW